MTREQTVEFIHSIVSLFPNWKPDNLSETVNAWNWALQDYTAQEVKAALMIYLKTNNTGFAPSVPQIITAMHAPANNNRMTEAEAWALVKRAIQDSIYNSGERFEALPPMVQRAVGDANMLRQWAMSDTDEVNTVIASHFQRNYRTIVERQQFDEKVPPAIADMVKGVSDRVAGLPQKRVDNIN